MNVATYMRRDPDALPDDTSLAEVKQFMEEKGYGLLLVVDSGGALKGFITRGALKEVKDWEIPVGEACFEARFAVSKSDTLEKAALILLENRLVLLPVVDSGQLVGVITQGDILLGLARALGIGLEGTRMTVRLRQGQDDLYKVLNILREAGVRLISMVHGSSYENDREVIFRLQEISDKEGVRAELEAALRG